MAHTTHLRTSADDDFTDYPNHTMRPLILEALRAVARCLEEQDDPDGKVGWLDSPGRVEMMDKNGVTILRVRTDYGIDEITIRRLT